MLDDSQIQRLRQAFDGVQAVYLFGSHAQGCANAESDVDVAVLAEKRLPVLTLWDVANELARELDADVDLIDLRFASTVLQYQVVTTGKPLWTMTPFLDVGLFETMVLSEMTTLNERIAPLLSDIQQTGSIYGR